MIQVSGPCFGKEELEAVKRVFYRALYFFKKYLNRKIKTSNLIPKSIEDNLLKLNIVPESIAIEKKSTKKG